MNNPEWNFLREQMKSSAEYQRLIENLACAFIFKIGQCWSELALKELAESNNEKRKEAIRDDLAILNFMYNSFDAPASVIREFETKVQSKLVADIKRRFTEVNNHETEEEALYHAIIEMRQAPFYKALARGDDMLCDELFQAFTVIDKKSSKTLIANVLFNLISDKIIVSQRNSILLGLILDQLGKDKATQCKKMLENNANIILKKPSEESLFPKKSVSFSTGLLDVPKSTTPLETLREITSPRGLLTSRPTPPHDTLSARSAPDLGSPAEDMLRSEHFLMQLPRSASMPFTQPAADTSTVVNSQVKLGRVFESIEKKEETSSTAMVASSATPKK